MNPYIRSLISKQKQGTPAGIVSICSANPYVISSVLKSAIEYNAHVLIESTSNQVDQYGGYTGMKPSDFVKYIHQIADKLNFPLENLILGGDHLGPNVWSGESAESAMQKARTQIGAYIKAGYTKIHLDASMPLSGDGIPETEALPTEIAAKRSAELCLAAEEAVHDKTNNENKPFYVIGTDVPIPGGAQEKLENIVPTTVDDVEQTVIQNRNEFKSHGLEDAFNRVVAVVVQPGVEYADNSVIRYDPHKASELVTYIEEQPNLIYEAHSTDYQLAGDLLNMVKNQFAILKVGPWLTFALREALIALQLIEEELYSFTKSINRSNLKKTIASNMKTNPVYWRNHYSGTEQEIELSILYSYSDRIRYYWPHDEIDLSLKRLISNLSLKPIPMPLISQYLPRQYRAIQLGKMDGTPMSLIEDKIGEVLRIYYYATGLAKESDIN